MASLPARSAAAPASPTRGWWSRAIRTPRAIGGSPASRCSILRPAASPAIAAPRAGRAPTRSAEPSRAGRGMAPDSLRQLVHELRTPTNAIAGFAEMIETQMLGPVADRLSRARGGDPRSGARTARRDRRSRSSPRGSKARRSICAPAGCARAVARARSPTISRRSATLRGAIAAIDAPIADARDRRRRPRGRAADRRG